MKKSEVNIYLSFGLIIGVIVGCTLIFLNPSEDINELVSNIVEASKIMAIAIPILVIVNQVFKLIKKTNIQTDNEDSLSFKPLESGIVIFIFSLALFIVPILLIIIIFQGTDGGQLRDLIYQNMNWNVVLGGLLATIAGLYGSSLANATTQRKN